ncbi:flagellar biosynthesis protein FlgN [Thermoclostridium stercorarium subsp. leptospartum DSM 9219]|uniref:Flagellar biosynthesis protein FlgN n=1 Tax=Thermoclostridium stercorarium subsp. leptospartum DSM 9219 TaxID=1346611 RepID=A0A1B1YNR9_THEST|nr:flagellar export chaperone FlgN [Thermoclostridium stercorarium]ANX02388.1 flagellar biosynthesis protein FlgN [Thermoclostridium stercorarium subsp. leptospartum DSM 9219]
MQEQTILEQMIKLSAKKLELLKQLKALSEKQDGAFREQRLDEVERVLNKKDEIIDYIGKLDDAFLKASDALKKLLGIESLTQLEDTGIEGCSELKSLIEQITALVEEIIKIEKQGYENAVALQNQFGQEIKNINNAKKIASAYTPKPLNVPSYFIDKKK